MYWYLYVPVYFNKTVRFWVRFPAVAGVLKVECRSASRATSSVQPKELLAWELGRPNAVSWGLWEIEPENYSFVEITGTLLIPVHVPLCYLRR